MLKGYPPYWCLRKTGTNFFLKLPKKIYRPVSNYIPCQSNYNTVQAIGSIVWCSISRANWPTGLFDSCWPFKIYKTKKIIWISSLVYYLFCVNIRQWEVVTSRQWRYCFGQFEMLVNYQLGLSIFYVLLIVYYKKKKCFYRFL